MPGTQLHHAFCVKLDATPHGQLKMLLPIG